MAKIYHPPKISAYLPPISKYAQYIIGATGVQGFGCADFYVAQIPCKIARAIIKQNHYSKSVVNNSYINLGVFIDGAFEGVLQFGYALQPARAAHVVKGTVQGEYLELNRMWLSDNAPRNSESRAISYAIKYIKRACSTVAWIQSYADERCNGLGVVYQAANFIYLNYHLTVFYELDGEFYHKMMLSRKNVKRAMYLQKNISRAVKHIFKQFRYIFFIKRNWIKRLNFKICEYPKPHKKVGSYEY